MKIISGGQTGADRGGLDAAIELGIEHGGWCPRNRRAEDEIIPECYQLKQTADRDYMQRTEFNVRDSDVTLIFAPDPITRGSLVTIDFCLQMGKPHHWTNMKDGLNTAVRASVIKGWMERLEGDRSMNIINVAGSRESKFMGIQKLVKEIMLQVLA
jgi:hypothetical protein